MVDQMAFDGMPFVIELKVMPAIEPSTRDARSARSLRTMTWAAPTTNVSTAFASTFRIRDEYLRRTGGRPGQAVEELVQLSQGFADDPIVAAARRSVGGRYSGGPRGRGRPRGMTAESLEVGAAVFYIVQESVARGSSIEGALADLSIGQFEQLSFDRLHGLYYRMRRFMRPDALMFTGAAVRDRLIEGPNVHTIWQAESRE